MLFHRETNSKSGKIYLLASMKYTWSGAHVSCGVASFQIETPKDIDDFTIRPTHRSNLGVGWSRGSNSRYREPKEVFGHGKGKVKSIPKADRRIGKRVSQIVLKDVWKIHTTWLR